MLSQNSQSMVGVAFVIDDARCVANFHVNVIREGSTTTNASESSPVIVDGLDLCLYNYSFVGYTTSMTGEVSGVSVSMDLTVNLTTINGVTVAVNQMDSIIEWTRIDRILYPSCITGYVVTDLGNQSLTTNVDSSTTSLTAQQLNAAGFPYCISILPTVTPMTPMGPLATVVGSSNLTLIDPDFPTPILTYRFALVNQSENVTGVVVLHVTVQYLEKILLVSFKVNPQTPLTLSQSLYPSLPTNPRSYSSSQLSNHPIAIQFCQTFLALLCSTQ